MPYPEVEEYPDTEKLSLEKSVLGVYISGHPLGKYVDLLQKNCTAQSLDFAGDSEDDAELDDAGTDEKDRKIQDGAMYVVGGIITDVSVKLTRNNQNMAYVTLEDLVGQIDIVVFPRDFEKHREQLRVDNRVFVRGRADVGEKDSKIILSDLVAFDNVTNGVVEFASQRSWGAKQKPVKSNKQLWVLFDDMNEYVKNEAEFMSILEEHRGNCPVYVQLKATRQMKSMGRGFCVDENSGILYSLQMEYGKDRVLLRDV